ncbi:ubiquinone biosynthesis protein [Streptomyces griseochromogenes]|uniref:ABC transporter n=1 Tax=Streptomyces griseochromogenes TaxID=68214 RepID=A0A1B1AY19_9ACTN|nr:AarF/UbiB family protein [Streptomyces griseochromogenes]ANP51437.1 ABC transporter [Streptomyces griseochromogenes]MBP2049808.1 ubiquinone biosynthesis protein [Streptomyces griseochromogenes]
MARAAGGILSELPGTALRVLRVGGTLFGYAVVFGPAVLGARLRRRRWAHAGERLSALLTSLGPSYIKIGQLLSTRRDLLPERVRAELGRLADATPAPRRARLEGVVRGAYQGRSWPFAEFGWTPMATGSIATVHRAVTLDGRKVAVKVRRPGIDRVMRRDFRLTALAMGGMQRLPRLRSMPFKVMHAQVGGAILHQLDFAAERSALGDLRTNLREFAWIRIPAPMPDLCTEDVLVMEYVEGLARTASESLSTDARKAAARRVMSAVYEMLFVDGLVHCDLHPGNLYIEGDGSLVILDAGFVIKLSEPVRASFADFFINMAMGNGPLCAEIIIESAASIAEGCDLGGFRAGLAELVTESTGARSSEFNLAKFAGRLFDLQRRFGLYPVPEFAFPLLSLLVVEGIVQSLDPELDFQAEAMPVLRRRNMPRASVGS